MQECQGHGGLQEGLALGWWLCLGIVAQCTSVCVCRCVKRVLYCRQGNICFCACERHLHPLSCSRSSCKFDLVFRALRLAAETSCICILVPLTLTFSFCSALSGPLKKPTQLHRLFLKSHPASRSFPCPSTKDQQHRQIVSLTARLAPAWQSRD